MMASRRDGEITYYEELGLSRRATAAEIHDAYRLHVRLLHPDQHPELDLKQAAETQMRKLNRIHDVLSDPDKRLRYDRMLEGEHNWTLLGPVSPEVQQLRSRLAWAGAIVLSGGLLVWLAVSAQPPALPESAASQPTTSVFAASAATPATRNSGKSPDIEIARLRAELTASNVELDNARREVDRLRASANSSPAPVSLPAAAPESKPVITVTEPPQIPAPRTPAVTVAALPRVEREHAPPRQLAGFWFYNKPANGQTNKNRALYPPEYIEATVMEENGVIHGKFRARYEILDRAISPDVNFSFTGTENGMQATGPWIGAGGSRGDITLKLTSDNAMKIDWTASELGTQLGLSSGTAVLTRRLD